MPFGLRHPRLAMGTWMAASFAAFVAPFVATAFLTPEEDDAWKAMVALLAPLAFAVGFGAGGKPLDERGMRLSWGIRAVEPAFAAFLAGMAIAAPTALVALVALHLLGGFSREAALIAVASPLSLGGTAVFLIRAFWPAE